MKVARRSVREARVSVDPVRRAGFLIAALALAACGDPKAGSEDSGVIGFDAEPDAGPFSRCEPPREVCPSGCVNTTTDPLNCGMCGKGCETGAFCMDGQCVRVCSGGLMACGASCIDPATDLMHCGGCDRPCPEDRACRGGSCVCPDRYSECHSACIDTDTDRNNCGICDRACEADEICNTGSCECAGGSRESDCLDGNDNDCDDLIDCADPDCAGSMRPCMGACGPGAEVCQMDGTYGACEGGNGEAELCGDGIDQDCNGSDLRNEDMWEPNDTCADCAMIMEADPNGLVMARFDSVDDSADCYAFTGDDGTIYPEHIRITLDQIPAGHDYDVYLYQGIDACNSRTPLASSAQFGEVAEMIDWGERFGTNDDATYYIRVVRYSGHSCTDDYRLSINGLN